MEGWVEKWQKCFKMIVLHDVLGAAKYEGHSKSFRPRHIRL